MNTDETLSILRRRGGLTYLAGPYSDPDPLVRDRRARALDTALAWLLRARVPVFSPISMTHEMAKRNSFPTDFEPYWHLNRLMVQHSSSLVVTRLPGWETSRGVEAELELATASGKWIFWLDPSPDDWQLSLLPEPSQCH